MALRHYNSACLSSTTLPFYTLHFSARELLLIICSLNSYPLLSHVYSKGTWGTELGPDFKFKGLWPLTDRAASEETAILEVMGQDHPFAQYLDITWRLLPVV